MRSLVGGVGLAVFLASGTVFAQEEPIDDADAAMAEEPVEEEAMAEPVAEAEPPKDDDEEAPAAGASSKEGGDGVRFRFGVSGGAGVVSFLGTTRGYGGMDLRFGAQINDLIGVYAQPHLGFWGGSTVGGIMGASVLGDVTLIDHFFVGAGLGYAWVQNPTGFELHFRAGAYPLMGKSKKKVRRKGLMIGGDLRLYFVQGATFVHPMVSLGYEAF